MDLLGSCFIHKEEGFLLLMQNGTGWHGKYLILRLFAEDAHHGVESCRRYGPFVGQDLQAHGVELVGIGLGRNADEFQRIDLARIDVERTLELAELTAVDVVGGRQVDFHFGLSGTDHREDRHAGCHCFVAVEQMFLYISVERCVQFRIGQLIFVMLVFGRNLFQSIDRLVIVVGRRTLVVVEGYDAFGLRFDLMVFSLGCIQLHLVVAGIQFGQELSFADSTALFDTDPLDGATHSKSQVHILGCFYLAGKLQPVLLAG